MGSKNSKQVDNNEVDQQQQQRESRSPVSKGKGKDGKVGKGKGKGKKGDQGRVTSGGSTPRSRSDAG